MHDGEIHEDIHYIHTYIIWIQNFICLHDIGHCSTAEYAYISKSIIFKCRVQNLQSLSAMIDYVYRVKLGKYY